MRNEFINRLTEHAAADDRIFLLCGDLGYSVLETFAERFPERFVNVGIAEQNMVGVAAGLAMDGWRVFTYSIVNFAVTRCLEQLRNDVCHHGLNVTTVAVGGGFAYGAQGYTHHGSEDIAFARMLPGMQVVVPADPAEAEAAADFAAENQGPAYIRLARGREAPLHEEAIGPLANFRCLADTGAEVAILACGPVAGEAMAAAKSLGDGGVVGARVFSLPAVNRIDPADLRRMVAGARLVVTTEEHTAYGGLGSQVAELLADAGDGPPLLRLGIDHANRTIVGSQTHLRSLNGLDAPTMADAIRNHPALR